MEPVEVINAALQLFLIAIMVLFIAGLGWLVGRLLGRSKKGDDR